MQFWNFRKVRKYMWGMKFEKDVTFVLNFTNCPYMDGYISGLNHFCVEYAGGTL